MRRISKVMGSICGGYRPIRIQWRLCANLSPGPSPNSERGVSTHASCCTRPFPNSGRGRPKRSFGWGLGHRSYVISLACLLTFTGLLTVHAQDGGGSDPGSGSAAVCPGFQTQLAIGAQGIVLPGTPNNLRENPSTHAARIGSIPGGDGFIVVDGPECADGYTWWLVQYRGTTGWTVEGTLTERYVSAGVQSSSSGSLVTAGSFTAGSTSSDLIGIISDTDTSAVTPSGEICVTQADPPQPIISSGIGAFALADYSADTQRFAAAGSPAVVPIESGGTISNVALLQDSDSQPVFGYSPAICVIETSGSASAIAPSGEIVEPYLQGIHGITQVQLPARAYIEPGDWRLRVGEFTLTIQIAEPPTLSAPFHWAYHAAPDDYDGFAILGGYAPDDQIAAINGSGEVIHAQANRRGYAIAQFRQSATISAIVPQSGDHVELAAEGITITESGGSAADRHFTIPADMSRDILYNGIWLHQPFDAGTWTCPGAMPIRMREGVIYTLAIDRLNVRQSPGPNGPVVTTLSRGDAVTVINGVACADNKTWWHLSGTDFDGWAAEGEGGQYFFEAAL